MRAAVYTRISLDRTGEEIGVQRQERDCLALADRLGWRVVQVFSDNDTSAYDRRKARPGYKALVEAIKARQVDAVLAWNPDRLHRRMAELEDYIDIVTQSGVVTHTVKSGRLDIGTVAGRQVIRVLGSIAMGESERTAERTRAGKRDAATRGRWNGGQRMYGWEVVPLNERGDGPALRVLPGERDLVVEAAKRVLGGESLRSLAREFNERGCPTTQGKAWNGSAVRKVLIRPTTAGLREVDGQHIPGDWEPLLDPDLWRGVVAVLSDPGRKTTDRTARIYLGSGLFVCGVCGGGLTGNTTAGGGSTHRKAAYRCRQADYKGEAHVTRDVASLDEHVVVRVLARLSLPDAAEALTPPDQRGVLAGLHEQAGILRARKDQAGRAFASGDLDMGLLTTINRDLDRQLAEIASRVEDVSRKSAVAGLTVGVRDVVERWQSLSLGQRRAVVDALCVVTVLPRTRRGRLPGGSYFDQSTVRIDWR